MNLNQAALLTVFLVNALLAFFTYLKNRQSIINKTFAFFTLGVACWSASLVFLQLTASMLWSNITFAFGLLMGLGFMLFAEVFPDRSRLPKKRSLLAALAAAAIAALLPFDLIVKGIRVHDGGLEPILGTLYPLFMIYVLTTAGYSFARLIWRYRKLEGLARLQIRYLFWGLALFTLGALSSNVILPSFGIYQLAFLGPTFSTIFIGAVLYSIVRHRLMDINLVLGKGALKISAVVLSVVPIFSSGLFLYRKILEPLGFPFYAISLIGTVLVALLYPKAQSILENRLGKYLAGEIFTFRELLRESQRIFVEEIKLETLARELTDLLNRSFTPHWQAILVSSGQKSAKEIPYRTYSFGKDLNHRKIPPRFFKQLEKLSEGELFITAEALHGVKANKKIGTILENLEAEVCAPLFSRGRFVGVFLLGPRKRDKVYSKEELDILQMVVNQAAISIDNARLYQETQDFNITLQEEIKKATADLKKAYDKLKSLDKMKDEFISITSHELRTPMTAVQGYLWMLEKKGGKLNEKQKRYLDRAQRGSERMISLINDMLDVSRIEQERVELNIKAIDPTPIIKEVIDELQVKAKKKKLKLEFLSGDKPLPQIKADADKVRRVLRNLLDNAIKFTDRGSVTIEAYKKGRLVQVNVADTGRGISKTDIPRLFKKFGRLESDFVTAAEAGGTGLGLYISRALVERMRGKISVQSEPNKGSTFSFTLPIS